jgi:hypothetical protein
VPETAYSTAASFGFYCWRAAGFLLTRWPLGAAVRAEKAVDEAPTETFFNSLKNERVHGTRYRTHREAVANLFEYIEVFYHRSRRHSSLGFASPTQFMQDWLSAQPTKDTAA